MVQRGSKPTNRQPAGKKALPIALPEGRGATVFNYVDIPEENRGEVHELVGRIRKNKTQMFVAGVVMGVDLLKLKHVLPHGQFGALLKREFQWTQKTAENYMKVARHFGAIIEPFSDLNLTTARALLAPSTPAKIRDELFARAEAGETITCGEVRQRIAEAKDSGEKPAAKSREVASDRAEHTEVGLTLELRSTEDETIATPAVIERPVPPPTAVSPAEEVYEALLTLAHAIGKNSDRLGRYRDPNVGPHCDPYDVAGLAMDGMCDNRLSAISKCSEFVRDVAFAMLDKEASPLLRKMAGQSKG